MQPESCQKGLDREVLLLRVTALSSSPDSGGGFGVGCG